MFFLAQLHPSVPCLYNVLIHTYPQTMDDTLGLHHVQTRERRRIFDIRLRKKEPQNSVTTLRLRIFMLNNEFYARGFLRCARISLRTYTIEGMHSIRTWHFMRMSIG